MLNKAAHHDVKRPAVIQDDMELLKFQCKHLMKVVIFATQLVCKICSLSNIGPAQIYRYRPTAHHYVLILKLFLRLEKIVWLVIENGAVASFAACYLLTNK